MNEIEQKIAEVLEEIQPAAEADCTTLIDDNILDSFDILSLIADISDEFDISIPASEIIPENFNSVSALAAMVEKLS